MPRYQFECDGCGHGQELTCSWSQRPSVLPCPECGGTAEPVITGGQPPVVKGTDWQWDPKWCIPNIGRHVRSDAEQYRLHEQVVSHAKKQAAQARRDRGRRSDAQWEHVGKVPLEIYEGVVEHTKDKSVWQHDTENLLKKTGCWLGE